LGYNDLPRVTVLQSSDLSVAFEPDLGGVTEGDFSKVAWSLDGTRLLAAGKHHDDEGNHPVLVWDQGGRGARSSWPGAAQTVMQILPLKDGGTVLAAADPLWAILDQDGARRTHPDDPAEALQRRAQQADFTGAFLGRFHVSADGSSVEIGTKQGGLEPLAFRVRDFACTPAGKVPGSGLEPPVREANGLKLALLSAGPSLNGEAIVLDRNEICRSGAISPKGDRVVLGTSFALRAFSPEGAPLWPRRRAPAEVWAVNISGDGRFVIAAYGDGTLRWHRMSDGEPLLSLFLHRGRKSAAWEWICWSPEGYYQASANGDELIGWQVNRGPSQSPDFYSANQLKEIFQDREEPGILASVIETAQSSGEVVASRVAKGKMRPAPTLAAALRGVPSIEFADAEQLTAGVVQTSSVVVTVIARPTEKDVAVDGSTLELKVNGKGLSKAFAGNAQKQPDGSWKRTWTVPLAPGRNELRAVARSEIDTKSYPARLVVRYKSEQAEKGTLWILAIGLNAYQNVSYNLPYCVADIEGFVDAFTRRARDSTGRSRSPS